jgi:hypothetical protein
MHRKEGKKRGGQHLADAYIYFFHMHPKQHQPIKTLIIITA